MTARNWALIFLFFSLSLLGVFSHELSLDEARPWLIVSETGWTSLVSETRCEMHCLPWFFGLKALSEIFSSPLSMQILSVLLGTVTFGLIALFSPFSFFEKVLILLNYYLFFEFNLIARPYVLMTLGLFLCALTFPSRRSHPERLSAGLLLLANSTYFGIFLSAPFALLMLYELIAGKISAVPKRRYLSYALLLAFGACVIWYSLPLTPSYGCVGLPVGDIPLSFERLRESLWDITRAFFILSTDSWNEHIADYTPWAKDLLTGVWVLAIIGISWGFRKNPRAFFLFVFSVFLFVSYRFTKPVYYGSFLRHLGALAVMYIAAVWVDRREGPPPSGFHRGVFVLFLLCGTFSGLRLFGEDLRRPFGQGEEVRSFISRPEYRDARIIADSLLFSSTYLIGTERTYTDYLDAGKETRYFPLSLGARQVYVAPAHVRGIHIVPKVREETFRRAVEEFVTSRDTRSLVIINYPARGGLMESMGLELVGEFTGAINPNEDYYVYRKKD